MAEIPDSSKNSDPEKICFQIKQQLLESLNIFYSSANSKIIGWTKYQILLFNSFNFEFALETFTPEFHIKQLAATNNYLVCLDIEGNVHTTSLKFKGAAQKRFKSSFQQRDEGILCFHCNEDNILTFKLESDKHYLCIHKIDSEFLLEKKIVINFQTEWSIPSIVTHRCLLNSHLVSAKHIAAMKKIMNVEETNWTDYHLVVVTFDKLTVSCCLISTSMVEKEICLKKLHVCPTEICDVVIIEDDNLHIVIGLTTGTVIKIPMNPTRMTPEVQHLNTALYKFKKISNNIIMYTDGVTMWKVEDLFSSDIKFRQFFVRQVNDFVKYGEHVVCSTFSKLIYLFQYDDANCYLKENITNYNRSETLLNNSEYLHKILEEVEKSKEIVKKVNKEGNFIAALSLSNRQDIMNNILQHEVVVYERYEDATTDNAVLILTEPLEKYFEPNIYLFLIKLSVCTYQQMFNDVISNLYADLKLHMSMFSENKVIKTTTIQVNESLKKLNILIPLSMDLVDVIQTIVDTKLSANLPGPLDSKQMLWVPLFRKQTILNSEHFIRRNSPSNRHIKLKDNENIDELLLAAERTQHGNMFEYKDASETKSNQEWALYVKLPPNYIDLFTNESYCKEFISLSSISFLLEQFKSEEFLKSRSSLILNVGYEKVNISILNEFASLQLLVKSKNILVAHHIRNFFACFVYNDFKSCQVGIEYMNISFFQTNESIRDKIKQKVQENCTPEELLPIIDEFHKCIIGAMPI